MCGRYYVDDETAEEIEKVIRLERSGPSNSYRYTPRNERTMQVFHPWSLIVRLLFWDGSFPQS